MSKQIATSKTKKIKNRKSYQIPDDLKKFENYLEIKDLGIGLLVNSHKSELKNGTAILSKNLFTFIFNGRKNILTSEDKIVLQKNESAVLKKGSYVVSERFDTEDVFKNLLIFFSDSFVEMITDKSEFDSLDFSHESCQKFKHNQIIVEIIDNLNSYMKMNISTRDSARLLSIKVRELFVFLQIHCPKFSTFLYSISVNKKSNLISVFEKHYTENLNLSEYAHLTGSSISSIKRFFKKEFDMTPMRWIMEKKLTNSKHLLLDKNFNISEIAYQVGFESVSHFSNRFKHEYGKSPSDYRDELFK